MDVPCAESGFDVRWELARDQGVPVFTSTSGFTCARRLKRASGQSFRKGSLWPIAKSRLDYRRALLVRTGDMTARSRQHLLAACLVSHPRRDRSHHERETQEESARVAGLFERLGLVDEDGETVRITPHQLRHYMTTLANEGNLSQLDIARWAGRSDVRHNEYYDHETAGSLVSKARAVDEDMFGGAVTVTPRQPVTAKQLMQGTSARRPPHEIRRVPA